MKVITSLATMLIALILFVGNAHGDGFEVRKGDGEDCSAGACFPKSVTLNDTELVLRKTHLFRYWGFRVYSVALYTTPDFEKGDDILDDVPRRLVLHYHRSIEREKMIEGAEVVIPRNEGDNMDALKERLEKVNESYVDVSSGDEYAIDYLPGEGLVISLNGDPKVSVEGADFARAYFGIWLGENPINNGLKRALLDFDH